MQQCENYVSAVEHHVKNDPVIILEVLIENSQWYDTPAGPHPADGRGLQPLGQDQASDHQQEVPL